MIPSIRPLCDSPFLQNIGDAICLAKHLLLQSNFDARVSVMATETKAFRPGSEAGVYDSASDCCSAVVDRDLQKRGIPTHPGRPGIGFIFMKTDRWHNL